jgi:hypothetical protein
LTVRLVGIDIDGTLLDSRGEVPLRNCRAVQAAADLGVRIVVITGRSFAFAAPIAARLRVPLVLIASNGAVVKTLDGLTLASSPLPVDIARAVVGATSAYRGDLGVVFDVADGSRVIYERIDWTHPRRRAYFERNRDVIAELSPVDGALDRDPLALVFNGSMAPMRRLRDLLLAAPFAARVEVSITEYASRDFAMVDVLARACTKAATLEAWAARLAIGRADIMAIGDNHNDLEMLALAGTPVVMGNAVRELRGAAGPSPRRTTRRAWRRRSSGSCSPAPGPEGPGLQGSDPRARRSAGPSGPATLTAASASRGSHDG